MTHLPAPSADPGSHGPAVPPGGGGTRELLEHTIGYGLGAVLLVGAAQGAVPVLGPLIAAGGILVGALGAGALAGVRHARAAAPTVAPPPEAPPAAMNAAAELKRMRHDARGHLVPAMLCAERLQAHADPAVVKAATTILASLDRTTAGLADAPDPAPPGISP